MKESHGNVKNTLLEFQLSSLLKKLRVFFFLFILQNEEKLREALLFANACGAITVTERGAIPALPTKEAVLQILPKANA